MLFHFPQKFEVYPKRITCSFDKPYILVVALYWLQVVEECWWAYQGAQTCFINKNCFCYHHRCITIFRDHQKFLPELINEWFLGGLLSWLSLPYHVTRCNSHRRQSQKFSYLTLRRGYWCVMENEMSSASSSKSWWVMIKEVTLRHNIVLKLHSCFHGTEHDVGISVPVFLWTSFCDSGPCAFEIVTKPF